MKGRLGKKWGEDKTWTRGPWTPTLDRVQRDKTLQEKVTFMDKKKVA